MRIVCPSCAAAYDVPAERFEPGRPVRCSACDNGWLPWPLVAEPQPLAAIEPDFDIDLAQTEPVPRPARPVPGPDRLRGLVQHAAPSPHRLVQAGWIATALVLGTAVWAGVRHREGVMQAWPPSERVYVALGLAKHP